MKALGGRGFPSRPLAEDAARLSFARFRRTLKSVRSYC